MRIGAQSNPHRQSFRLPLATEPQTLVLRRINEVGVSMVISGKRAKDGQGVCSRLFTLRIDDALMPAASKETLWA